MMKVTNLVCEYRITPLGIDVEKPRLSWRIDASHRNVIQTAYQIIVSSSESKLQKDEGDLWDSNKVFSACSIQVVYEGLQLKSFMQCWWKVRVWDNSNEVSLYSDTGYWEMGFLREEDWKAKWIGIDPGHIQKDGYAPDNVGLPSPYLRGTFNIEKPINYARIYATAFGLYELYLNGMKVGNDEYSPGWTDYNKRLQYQTYDVTKMLKQGDNAIGGILGDGWYTGNVAIAGRKQYDDYPLLFLMQMRIQYEDGTIEQVISDNAWTGGLGAVRYSDLQMGECHDATKEPLGFSTTQYNDRSWLNVNEYDKGYRRLTSQIGECPRVMKELEPVSVNCLKDNTYLFDLGQNMVGRVRLKIRGEAGTRITLRYGEMINLDGSLYTENLRTAAQTDVYVLSGEEEEFYEPKFTFHGFRYVEVTGYKGILDISAITGKVIYSALHETLKFDTSNNMINKLYSNILWGQRGNFLSIPTDCPQRDERMGWTGDGQVFGKTACFNMDCSSFFTKWVKDITDAQHMSGGFTDVAPYVRKQDGEGLVGYGNAAWGDAGVIIPWTLYQNYGDVRILEDNYTAMSKYIKYLCENSVDFIRPDSGFGDWLSVNADTPKDLMGTAYFAYAANLMAKIANTLGKASDAQKYEELFGNIKSAFNNVFVSADGRISGDTQTCYLLAIKMELLDDDKKILAAKHLVDNIEQNDGHLTTGFVGVSYLLPILTEEGFGEEAYKLLLNEAYPSWFYSIKNGATTIWERWNSYTLEDGFGDIGMNSFNHYSLGSVGEWLIRCMAGLDGDVNGPGYKHIIIKPYPGGGLSYVKAVYESIHGTIESSWKIEDKAFTLKIKIPANTTATVYIPHNGTSQITEGGTDITKIKECNLLGYEMNRAVISIGSGEYEFHCLL